MSPSPTVQGNAEQTQDTVAPQSTGEAEAGALESSASLQCTETLPNKQTRLSEAVIKTLTAFLGVTNSLC